MKLNIKVQVYLWKNVFPLWIVNLAYTSPKACTASLMFSH